MRTEHWKKDATDIRKYYKDKTESIKTIFKKNKVYSLSSYAEEMKTLLIDSNSYIINNSGENVNIEYDGNNNAIIKYDDYERSGYTITYYPAANFKRKIFKCTKSTISDRTGRISKMEFQEV